MWEYINSGKHFTKIRGSISDSYLCHPSHSRVGVQCDKIGVYDLVLVFVRLFIVLPLYSRPLVLQVFQSSPRVGFFYSQVSTVIVERCSFSTVLMAHINH